MRCKVEHPTLAGGMETRLNSKDWSKHDDKSNTYIKHRRCYKGIDAEQETFANRYIPVQSYYYFLTPSYFPACGQALPTSTTKNILLTDP